MNSPASPQTAPPRLRWLILFCLCAWLPGFFTLPPTDRDESRFAQASKQMIETGDYVRIMNGTEARNKKPIGIYWAQVPFAAAAKALRIAQSNPIWPYRLPSLLGALLAVLAVARGGAILAGRRQAWWAAAFLASSLLLISEAHIAKTDAALVGVTTVAMTLLARMFLGQKTTRLQSAGFWVALAAGILLKGPITPLVAGLTILALGITTRRWAWLAATRPLSGLILLLLLVTPWFAAIGIATHGAFFTQSVGGDLAGKLSGSDDAHGQPFGTYLALIPLLAFPAALPVLRAIPAAWRDRHTDETKFLLAWLIPAWLMFEIIHTKLPHYTLPLYPALFLLAAKLAGAPIPSWWRHTATTLSTLAALTLTAGVIAAPYLLHGAWWAGIPAGVEILAITAALALNRQAIALLLMPLAMFALFEIELPHLPALMVSPRLNAALIHDHLSVLPYGVAGYDEPSLMFLSGTNQQWFRTGKLLGDWMQTTPQAVALVESRELKGFLAADPGAHKIDEVDGYDYSNGKQVKISIYRN